MKFSKQTKKSIDKFKAINKAISSLCLKLDDSYGKKAEKLQDELELLKKEKAAIILELSKQVFEECQNENPIIIDNYSGEEKKFNDVFNKSYSSLDKLDKTILANMTIGEGKYRFK